MVRVARVRRNSIGADLEIVPGTALISINGRDLRDSLDLRFFEADAEVHLEVRLPSGQSVVYEIEKHPDEPLGLVPELDKVRRCTNACPFCFVKGNPKTSKLRQPLYVKDDDYRLSFMFGHYVTLTNLRDEDWDRIFEQRLSPLYVSVHATDPEARLRMLINPKAALIGEHLDRLEAGSIQVHAQVVLCPGINDGEILEGTINDLYSRADQVLSLSIVPVGLTEFNADRGVRTLTPEECTRGLAMADAIRKRAVEERGRAWCYAADEMFLQAGLPLPVPEYFDDHELVANGVGAVSALASAVRSDLDDLPALGGKRVVLVTGTSMRPYLTDLAGEVSASTGASVATVAAHNSLYGPMVTTAGLLAGVDYARALDKYRDFDLALFSRTALNDQDLFLDDLSLSELRRDFPELRICPSEHVTDTLLAL
jgi:putative radical SAM enzyme (TIGR03279 family)